MQSRGRRQGRSLSRGLVPFCSFSQVEVGERRGRRNLGLSIRLARPVALIPIHPIRSPALSTRDIKTSTTAKRRGRTNKDKRVARGGASACLAQSLL